jgi:hypothetical protein
LTIVGDGKIGDSEVLIALDDAPPECRRLDVRLKGRFADFLNDVPMLCTSISIPPSVSILSSRDKTFVSTQTLSEFSKPPLACFQ